MAPFISPPSWAMQRPLTTMGEHDVKNWGAVPLKSSLRQRTLPVAASRHESVPRTPSRMTLPSTTVGELRGPEKYADGPLAPCDSYLSCHTSLPVIASRQRVISLPPCRANTYNLSPTSAGVETPSPTATFHF